MRKFEVLGLVLILIGAFVVRLYKFDNPIADWHSWRQADTSAVSRNFVKYGFDILHPRFDDLSKNVSNLDNPNGYRFVEFPLYNALQAGFFGMLGGLGGLGITLEQWGRLISIFASLLATLFLYLIVKNHSSTTIGLLAAFFYAFLPFNIYYGRTILPDPAMVMVSLGGIYFFDKWLNYSSELQFKIKNYLLYLLALIFTASALLLKPFALFFTLPIVYLAFRKFGFALIKKWQLWLFLIVTVLPLILWRWWIQQYPEGIPQSIWIFNGNGIRFKGAFFYWIFADRIGKLILGYWGIGLFVLGLVGKNVIKGGIFFSSFLLSTLLYLFVVAAGNVQHDYYQILITPSIAIFLALGSHFLLKVEQTYLGKAMQYGIIVVVIFFMFMFGWYHIRDYYNINHPEIVEAGRAVDARVEKDAKVIAPYNGDTTLLYHTNRQGWPVFDRKIEEFIQAGATHLLFVNPRKEELSFANDYKVVLREENYIIYDLKIHVDEK